MGAVYVRHGRNFAQVEGRRTRPAEKTPRGQTGKETPDRRKNAARRPDFRRRRREVGSWPFIIVQSCLLVLWVTLNVLSWVNHWDPYPFILLNLALSFQAAYAAPFIMMSQNRQAALDRNDAKNDYDINIKAELEIELLHQKLDLLRGKEIMELMTVKKI